MLTDFTTWLVGLLKDLFGALWDFVADAFVHLVQLVTAAILAVIQLIPVPDFLSSGMQSFFNGLDGGIMWLLTQAGVPQGLAIIGTAYLFRLGRKVATLFQW